MKWNPAHENPPGFWHQRAGLSALCTSLTNYNILWNNDSEKKNEKKLSSGMDGKQNINGYYLTSQWDCIETATALLTVFSSHSQMQKRFGDTGNNWNHSPIMKTGENSCGRAIPFVSFSTQSKMCLNNNYQDFTGHHLNNLNKAISFSVKC